MAIFRQKMLQFLATFLPICKSFGIFSAKLLKFRLLFCQNSDFGIFLEPFGYFWEYSLVALLGQTCPTGPETKVKNDFDKSTYIFTTAALLTIDIDF